MKRRNAVFCMLSAASLAAVGSDCSSAQEAGADPVLRPFEFRREGATSPEEAAAALFQATATQSPTRFVQHLLLGVCDGSIDTLQKFAEHLHSANFRQGENSYTVYDMPRQIDREKPMRAIASRGFDSQDKQVAALRFEEVSTYYGERFKSVDVVAEGYDGLDYQMRIVVAQVMGRWYAIPRCRSSKSFYAIADTMPVASPGAKEAK